MLARGGFADLRMATVSGNGSEIRFSDTGRLALSGAITLDTPQISWAPNAGAAADGLARLDAAYVALGSSTLRSGTGVGTASATAQGGFLAAADLIDLRGALGFDGFSDVALSASGDIRFSGIRIDLFRDRQYSGSLSQPGRLLLAARRAYATTLADYHLSAGTLATAYPEGVDQVASGLFGSRAPALTAALAAHAGLDLGVVLSAASNLSFTADDIHLGADLSAPLGRLTLTVNQASQGSMVVDSGARISTAATDAVTPLGQTQAGLDWLYPLTGGGGNLVFSPERTRFSNRIEINADRITLDPGATVDVSAAGDLQAWEFIPGPGGSRDGLASGDGVDQFAIMPGLGRYAPLDPNETAASTLQVGDAIHLAGMPGLPSGDYALLPSHYALLDGAFLVTPVKGTGDMLVGEPPSPTRWRARHRRFSSDHRYRVSGCQMVGFCHRNTGSRQDKGGISALARQYFFPEAGWTDGRSHARTAPGRRQSNGQRGSGPRSGRDDQCRASGQWSWWSSRYPGRSARGRFPGRAGRTR